MPYARTSKSRTANSTRLAVAMLVTVAMVRAAFAVHTWLVRVFSVVVALVALWAAISFLRALSRRTPATPTNS